MKKYRKLIINYLKNRSKKLSLILIGIILSVSLITSILIINQSVHHTQIKQAIKLHGNYHVHYKNLTLSQINNLKKVQQRTL